MPRRARAARSDGPRTAHVVPAWNEVDQFSGAVRTRLREGYPDAEFVLVDDRTTDGTGPRAGQLDASDGRVRVLHLRDLPDGWLGKVHALHGGTQIATGDWLLIGGADAHVQPGTLTRAPSHRERGGWDRRCVFPDVWRGTFLLDIVMAMFLRVFCIAIRPHAVSNPRSRADVGVGAFNLVRRAAFAQRGSMEYGWTSSTTRRSLKVAYGK